MQRVRRNMFEPAVVAVMIVVWLCQLSIMAMIFSGIVVNMDKSVMPMSVLEIWKVVASDDANWESVYAAMNRAARPIKTRSTW